MSSCKFTNTKTLQALLFFISILISLTFISCKKGTFNSGLKLNDSSYFESQGLNILVFCNWYNNNFSDSKMSGIEIIHHEVRTVTNGDVRLNPTPEQWDSIPHLIERKVNKEDNSIEVYLSYPSYNFNYIIKVKKHNDGVLLDVNLENPLPKELEGKAGFNLEFLPSAYFEKGFIMNEKPGVFPLYPSSSMMFNKSGIVEPEPIAKGEILVLAPEDPSRRITIKSEKNELLLFDGRNKAQNGWYVVRSSIPSGKSGKVVEWFLSANTIPNWIRPPVIAHSQVGYHPNQKKIAVIEFDKNDTPLKTARLLKVTEDGKFVEKFEGKIKKWGDYLRYTYYTFDFTQVKETGLYVIDYGKIRTNPFKIENSC